MKKSVTSMLLVLCLATPFVVTYLCLQIRQGQIRSAVKHRIMDELGRHELVLLRFTDEEAAEIRWKHAREFEFRGSMYDIVDSEVQGDTTSYWCWADHEETELNQKVRKLAAIALGDNPQNQENQTRLIDFCKSLFHTPTSPWQAECLVGKGGYSPDSPSFPLFDSAPPVPPPRLI